MAGGRRAAELPRACRLRVESVEVLDRLLTQSVMALIGEGLVKLVEIAVDGTKIRASASKQSLKTGAKLLEVEAAVAAPRPRAAFSTTPSLRCRRAARVSVHERELRLFECAGIASDGWTGCAA